MKNAVRELMVASIGAMAVGLGPLLASEETLTWRIVLGRMISSGALGASASVILIWYPDAPRAVMYGVAAGLASIGTSGLERIIQILLKR